MNVKITLTESVSSKVWYADMDGQEFQMVAQNFTHYIVLAPYKDEHRLMGVLKRHGEIIEAEDEAERTPDTGTSR